MWTIAIFNPMSRNDSEKKVGDLYRDQWDGTDIEPGHLRNTGKSLKRNAEDPYLCRYKEGQNCCDG